MFSVSLQLQEPPTQPTLAQTERKAKTLKTAEIAQKHQQKLSNDVAKIKPLNPIKLNGQSRPSLKEALTLQN